MTVDSFGIPSELLVEMARLGDLGQYSFWVYSEPLKNPSFHLKHKTDFEIVIQMKDGIILEIKSNNSRFEFRKGAQPPKQIVDVIAQFMNLKSLKDPTRTNGEFLPIVWKVLNE